MEDNWFTILCWFLPYINMNQPQVYMCPLPPEPPSRLLPHHTPLGCHERWAELSVSHSKFPLLVCFTYGDVYVSILSVRPSISFPPTVSVLCVCVSIAALQMGSSAPLSDSALKSLRYLPVLVIRSWPIFFYSSSIVTGPLKYSTAYWVNLGNLRISSYVSILSIIAF